VFNLYIIPFDVFHDKSNNIAQQTEEVIANLYLQQQYQNADQYSLNIIWNCTTSKKLYFTKNKIFNYHEIQI